MKRAWLILLGCVAACHSPSPTTPEPPPVSEPAPTSKPELSVIDDRHAPEPHAMREMPDGSSGSPCEHSCAALHTCLIVQGEPGSVAASIELGCLEACVPNPVSGSLFGCELPPASSSEPSRCDPFLSCVRSAWPGQLQARDPVPPATEPRARGCERACLAFARCQGQDQDDDDRVGIERCTEKCSEVLDSEQERIVGECSDLPDCGAIEDCVLSTPGA